MDQMESDNIYSACVTKEMKEFGEDQGVIYVDKPEDVLKKVVELIENGSIEDAGKKARRFVEKYNWDDIVDEFERILEDGL
jgi:glycosyltransferase involved in cell wall biosynthesis